MVIALPWGRQAMENRMHSSVSLASVFSWEREEVGSHDDLCSGQAYLRNKSWGLGDSAGSGLPPWMLVPHWPWLCPALGPRVGVEAGYQIRSGLGARQ